MATALAVPQNPPVAAAESAWQEAGWLPCRLTAELAVRGFTVGDLLSLQVGSLVDTATATDADLAVRVNGVAVGCAKLTVARGRLGVRLTELV
jgi:flagellar motor switch/type III secretory pathway protein FliN